jgi:anti-anti-sigma factor
MQQKNVISLARQDSVTVMDIHGDVTILSEQSLNEAYRNATQEGAESIVLCFDANAYINSGGIALLIQLLAQANSNHQRIAIAGLSQHFQKIFQMVGITKFAKIYPSVEAAVQGISPGS